MTTRAASFRALHRTGKPLLLPNAWDHASAAALAQGFSAIGTTSLGIAAAAGLPDAAGATRDVTLAVARSISGLPALLTVDIEGGFSDRPADVADLAAELATMGVVGVNIEDGRADGSLADVRLLCDHVAAVKDRIADLFINARTDAYWLGSGTAAPLPEAVRRAEAYVAAGADGIFVPGATDDETIRALVDAVDVPVNVLFTPGQSYRHLADLGVRRVSCGSLLFRVALQCAVNTAIAIRDGSLATSPDVPTYAEVQSFVGVADPA